jgi:hypothetical protein
MPDSTLSRRSAALLRVNLGRPLLRKAHEFHTEIAEEPNKARYGSDSLSRLGARHI